MVCPEQVENMKQIFSNLKIPYEVKIPNVASVIMAEQISLLKKRSGSFNWETYHNLSTIQDWMSEKAYEFPNLVSILTIGESFEKRPLQVLKISKQTNDSIRKPAIWIDAGIHAREWIAPAVATYMANTIIQEANQDPNYKLVDVFDWYIMANVNPDGYQHSHTNDRFWRKSRAILQDPLTLKELKCRGVDLNRNFNYKWGGRGASKKPCGETYCGDRAASEPETRSVQEFIFKNRNEIKLFLTFHSYSQMIFPPWGYSRMRVPDYEDMMYVGKRAAESLKAVYGTKYRVGPSSELLYVASGGSEDYAKGVAKIKYSYCIELRDKGKHKFMLPPDQIIPTGIETFAAVKSMAEDMIELYNLEPIHDYDLGLEP